MEEQLEKGADIQDLVRSNNTETYTFEYEGKSWDVRYRKIDWKIRFNAIEDGWKTKKIVSGENMEVVDDLVFDTAQYYETVLMAAIVDINGQAVTLPLLRLFDGPVITQLTNCVPGPSLIADLATAKKELSPSSEAT